MWQTVHRGGSGRPGGRPVLNIREIRRRSAGARHAAGPGGGGGLLGSESNVVSGFRTSDAPTCPFVMGEGMVVQLHLNHLVVPHGSVSASTGRGVVLRVEGGGRAGSRAHPVTTSHTAAVAAALAGLVTPGVGLSIRGAPLASVHGSGGAGAPVPPPPAAGPVAARPEEMSTGGRAGQAAGTADYLSGMGGGSGPLPPPRSYWIGSWNGAAPSGPSYAAPSGSRIGAAPGSNVLSAAPGSLVGRRFELEELEDADSCTTVVELNEDETITLGGTTGPKWLKASGNCLKEKILTANAQSN